MNMVMGGIYCVEKLKTISLKVGQWIAFYVILSLVILLLYTIGKPLFERQEMLEQEANRTIVKQETPKLELASQKVTEVAYELKEELFDDGDNIDYTGYNSTRNRTKPKTNTPKYEKTDVEVNSEEPAVYVKVNGEEHKFDLQKNETRKFEKGKVVVNQDSKISLDITVPKEHSLNIYTEGGVSYDTLTFKPVLNIGMEKVNGDFSYGYKYTPLNHTHYVYAKYNVAKLKF